MTVKILLDSLRLADGGRVECRIATPDGKIVDGAIEQAFFEDFMGVPNPRIGVAHMKEILANNLDYFEKVAEQQWNMGSREVVIS
ncbi:MAG: hypothetical protein DI585_04140 [Pseudomonas fluorescens]|nr:MAG: hypothetical protein DI585_04140 [Pseudomonas fluorescens]